MVSHLKEIEAIRVPMPPDYVEHANYKFYCFLDPKKLKVGWDRDRIISRLIELGIPCFSGSCSEVYLEKAFRSGNLAPEKALPNAKLLGETSLMFLVHPTLGLDHMEMVSTKVIEVLKKASIK